MGGIQTEDRYYLSSLLFLQKDIALHYFERSKNDSKN